ncbi:hypothetical protein TRIP_B330373 [uncultured Desulfatiglans sp.]|nr:hypothetical protein TRIP_B330373 [uncultured Desulfatiglans sp.]
MHPENPQEREQKPGDIVVDRAHSEAEIRLAMERWDQEEIDDPSDQKQAEGEKIDRSGDRPAEIEPVRSGEPEDPEDIAEGYAVG